MSHHTTERSSQRFRNLRRAVACLSLGLACAASFNGMAAPYSGTPISVPATFEAENFDRGGEGVGYHELTPGNAGGYYRTSESVDIIANTDPEGGGGVVQWFATGEWLAYTINVPADGNYDIAIKAANYAVAGAGFHIEVDNVNVTGKVAVPSTDSWNRFQWVVKAGVPLKAGTHVLKLVSDQQYFDVNQVRILASGSTTPAYSGTPYTGTPIAVPASFEAENFDRGGQGVAYHDVSAANEGGSHYRASEGVDIIPSKDPAGGGYVVQWFATGEWMAYTLNVPADGNYDISIRASNHGNAGAGFHAEIDGVDVTGKVTVPSTGGWDSFQWIGKGGVPLKAGKRVLKIVADQEYFDVNQVRITASAASAAYSGTPYTGTPIAVPKAFEAEDFDRGGQGVAYHDTTAANEGGYYRASEGVDIIANRDPAGGNGVIQWFATGEWLAYTLNVPADGNYDISIKAANYDVAGAAFHVEIDGVNVTGRVAMPSTGGWDRFQWVGKTGVPLKAGKRILKLVSDQQYFDLNQISVLASGSSTPTPAPNPEPTPNPNPTPAPTPTNPAEPAPIAGKGYHLVKNWDFVSGIRSIAALQGEFYPFYIYSNGTLNFLGKEWERYRDFNNGNHVFTAEGLALRAFLRSGQPFASGNIDSGMLRSKWFGKYGYFEVSMKVPPGQGLWPAFWLNPQDQGWPPEIDVVEIVNNGRDNTTNSFHYVHGAGSKSATYSLLDQWGSYRPGFDYKNDFHTFAVEWTPDRVRHFVDGKLVVDRPYTWIHNSGSDGGPAHVLLNLAVGGDWPGTPAASALPAQLVVKHIRVWQK